MITLSLSCHCCRITVNEQHLHIVPLQRVEDIQSRPLPVLAPLCLGHVNISSELLKKSAGLRRKIASFLNFFLLIWTLMSMIPGLTGFFFLLA